MTHRNDNQEVPSLRAIGRRARRREGIATAIGVAEQSHCGDSVELTVDVVVGESDVTGRVRFQRFVV